MGLINTRLNLSFRKYECHPLSKVLLGSVSSCPLCALFKQNGFTEIMNGVSF